MLSSEPDHYLAIFQLRRAIEAAQTGSRLQLAHLWRRLAQLDRACLATARSHYMQALGENRREALGGLFVIESLRARPRPLWCVAYLVFSRRDQQVLDALIDRLVNCPSELSDVELNARACVAWILRLVAAAGEGKQLTERVLATLPPTGGGWDALCIAMLIEVHRQGNETVEGAIKLLVGRALSLNRAEAILAAVDFEPTRSGIEQFCLVNKAWLVASAQDGGVHELDHLTGQGTVEATGGDSDAVARARLGELRSAAAAAVVIVDGANVACRAGERHGKVAAGWALKSVHEYYTRKGLEVKVVVSEKHLNKRRSWKAASGMEIRLDEAIEQLPPSSLVLIPPQNHDDSYMIALALRLGGVVVTNDLFRDWVANRKSDGERRLAEKWTKSHLIAFTFVDTLFQPNPDFQMPMPDTAALYYSLL